MGQRTASKGSIVQIEKLGSLEIGNHPKDYSTFLVGRTWDMHVFILNDHLIQRFRSNLMIYKL